MISHPVLVVDAAQRIVAVNTNLEQLLQVTRDTVLNQPYQHLTDTALVQNMESLIARSRQSPYEKQSDKIPFAQYECEIFCQVFLDADGEPQYFVLTLIQAAVA
jgi:transcriptional regulator with PAS, ATPase and Fis domain